MKVMRSTPALVLLVAGLLSGCGNNGVSNPVSTGATDDQTQAQTELASNPTVVEDGVSDSQSQSSMDGGGFAAIHPLNYWRTITRRDRTFEFAFSDTDTTGHPTRAIVTIRTHLVGRLNILAGDPGTDGTPIDSTRHVLHKPIDEVRVRRVLLRRLPDALWAAAGTAASIDTRPRWRVAAVSGVQVSSAGHTTDIVSLRIQQGATLDTTITDVLAFIRLRTLPRLVPGVDVTLTVTTGRADDVVVLWHNDHRFRLHNNNDNTYTGVFQAGLLLRGLRHLGVDAMSNGTLFDDTLPYDSQRWVLPFVFAPERLDGPPV